jgi:uncharacterized protein (TIGR03545 family)
MTDSTNKKNEELEEKEVGILRKVILFPLGVIILSLWIFFNFFFDSILLNSIKSTSEAFYGSSVEINDLKSSFLNGSLKIGKVSFSDQKDLSKNKIEFYGLNLSISPSNILRKKVIVQDITSEKIFFNKKRKTPGKLISDKKIKSNNFIILNDKIKDKSTEFLKFASIDSGISSKEISLKSKNIEKEINSLKDYNINYLKNDLKQIEQLTKKIKKEKNPIKKIKFAARTTKKISLVKKNIKKEKNKIEKKIKRIKNEINSLNNITKKSLSNAGNLLDKKKLKELIIAFTKNKINQYISPWIDSIEEYKTYLPKKTSSSKDSSNKIQDEIKKSGKIIDFKKDDDLPSFLIRNISLKAKKDQSKFDINIKNITNQFNSLITKTTGEFLYIEPSNSNITGNLILDSDNFLFEVSSAGKNVKDVKLLTNKNLNIKILNAIESWDFKYQRKTTNTEIFHSHNYQDSALNIKSGSKNSTLNRILKQSSKKINSIQISFGHNQNSKNKYLIKSSLMKDLPKAINSSLKDELTNLEKKSLDKIKLAINKEKKKLKNRLNIERKNLLKKLNLKIPKLKI